MAPEQSTEERLYFRDVKPYHAPDSLDQLHGPGGGVVELSHSVLWARGGGRVDLDEPGGLGLAYRAVLAEGTVEDQVTILNHERLVAVWTDLLLRRRVRELWEPASPSCGARSRHECRGRRVRRRSDQAAAGRGPDRARLRTRDG